MSSKEYSAQGSEAPCALGSIHEIESGGMGLTQLISGSDLVRFQSLVLTGATQKLVDSAQGTI